LGGIVLKISLIIASFCRPTLLDLGLWSLSAQKISYDLEVIVCNDGIEDSTQEVCKKYKNKLNIRYIFTRPQQLQKPKSRVAGFALNIGVKQSTGDIIILSCAEIFHLNSTINQIVEPLIYNKKLLTSPSIIHFDDTGEGVDYLSKNLTLNLPMDLLIKLQENTECKNATKMPFFMGMYKEEYINIGGYDEDFIGYAGDDNDLIFRLLYNDKNKEGLKYYFTQSQIIHLYHGNRCDSKMHQENPDWVYNYNLFINKREKKIIIRNQNKEWGVLC